MASLNENIFFVELQPSSQGILPIFDLSFCRPKTRQMILGMRLPSLNKPSKSWVNFQLWSQCNFFCFLKSERIVFQEPKKCFLIEARKHFTVCRFWGQNLHIGNIPRSYDVAVQNILGMNHHNKSVYIIHVIAFVFYTLHSQHRYLEDMLKGTNADLKISLHTRINLKIIHWKFRILNPNKSRVIYPQSFRFS